MPLYLHPKSKALWCRFKHQGIEYRKSTGETDKRKAEAWERAYRTQVEAGTLEQKPRITSHVLAECFPLDEARATAKGTKALSQVQLRFHWKTILSHLGLERPLRDVNYALITEYVSRRRGEGAAGQTIKKELYALRRGLNLAMANGWLPPALVMLPEVNRSAKDPLRTGKLHPPEILKAWFAELAPDARDTYQFALLTGLRLHEIKRIEPGWIKLAPSGSAVPAFLEAPEGKTKSGLGRTVALPLAAYAIVSRRLALGAPFVFCQKAHVVGARAATKRIGYDKNITCRDMRKIWATMTSRLSKDRDAVKSTLGHATMAMTDVYVHEADKVSLANASNLTAEWYSQNVSGTPGVAHQTGGMPRGTETANDSGEVLVGAPGIEPGTSGLRVCVEDALSIPVPSVSAHLAACRNTSAPLMTAREWHTKAAHGPAWEPLPWADADDVTLIG